jgi:hypothetical protein
MKHWITAIFSLVCILANALPGSGQIEETTTLEVIGRGTIEGDNVAQARNEAIADGLRNAVEQGVSLLIPSASVVESLQRLSDVVYSRADEVIHDYKVLAESRSDPYYRMVIQVTLLIRILEEKLEDIGIPTTEKGLPSVLLLLSEQNIGQAGPRHSWGEGPLGRFPSAIEKTLSKHMAEKGFFIINESTLLSLPSGMDLDEKDGIDDMDDKAAVRLAEQLNAEVVIFGQGIARLSGNISGTGIRSVEAFLSLRAIRIDDKTVIGSFKGRRTAIDEYEMIAGKEALTLAAADGAEVLSREIVASWSKKASEPVLVELLVQGIEEYGDFVTFRKSLKDEVQGVRNVCLRSIKSGEATMDVDIKGSARILADQLMLMSFEDFGLNIYDITPVGIKLEITPKEDIISQPRRTERYREQNYYRRPNASGLY